jgi:hypothetical protein
MIMKTRISVFALLVSLLLAALSPSTALAAGNAAPADPKNGSKLMIDNKTGSPVTVTLDGEQDYSFTANPGKTNQIIARGKYKVEFFACGATRKGSLSATPSAVKLLIPKCVTANVTIRNDTGSSLTLSLTGTGNYLFTLAPGKTKIQVNKGKYEYQVSGACGTKTGKINLGNRMVWRFWCS